MDAEEIPDDIKCPVCFEIPEKEIFQCKNGHTVCSNCSQTIRDCPQCRVPYGTHKIRNRALESLMDTMKFDCLYKSEGCTVRVKRREISNHLDVCSYASTHITLCEHLGYACGYLVDTKKLNDILAHFVTCHDFIIRHETNLDVCLEDTLYLNRNQESMWTPVVMNLSLKFGVTLLLINRFNPKDQCMSFACLKLDGPNAPQDVQMKFAIKAKIPNKNPDIMWTCPCVDIKYAEFTLRNPFFRFPAELLVAHYLRDSAIVINCSIERVEVEENAFTKETPETIWTFNATTSTGSAEASSSLEIFSMPPFPLPSSPQQQRPQRRSPPSLPVARKTKSRFSRHSISLFGATKDKSDKDKSCKQT